MISHIDNYIDFLCENSISEHQFLILWLIHTKDLTNITKYKRKFERFDVDEILDLIERGFIDDFGLVKDNQRTFNIYDFIVTDKFSQIVVIDEDDAYNELVSVYPPWILISGPNTAPKKVPSITGDPYKLSKEYNKFIKQNRLVHNDIIVTIKEYYKERKYAMEKIENCILNKRWILMKQENEEGKSTDLMTII